MQSSENISETTTKERYGRGLNPNSVNNLKPFKKGQSGNLSGKPKGVLNFNTLFDLSVESMSNKYVEQYNLNNKNKKITLDDVDIIGDIFIQLINRARNGDLKAIQVFLDHTYGKPRVMSQESYSSYEDSEEKDSRSKEAKKKAREMLDKWESGWIKN